jgi:hypothetical protein
LSNWPLASLALRAVHYRVPVHVPLYRQRGSAGADGDTARAMGVSVPRKSGTVPRREPARKAPATPAPLIEPAASAKAKAAASAGTGRGAVQFAAELARISEIQAGIAAAGDGAKAVDVVRLLRVEGGKILRDLNGRADLPKSLDVIERRRWRDATDRAGKIAAPKKPRGKRKVTPPPTPPVRVDSGWTQAADGTLSRVIEAR